MLMFLFLADVQQFERAFLSKSSRTRTRTSGTAAVVEEDDDKETRSDDADEDEDEAGSAPKRRPVSVLCPHLSPRGL